MVNGCGGPNRFSDGTSRKTSLGARQLDFCAIAEPLVPSPHPLLYGVTAEPPRTAQRGLPTKLVVHCSNKLVCSANCQCAHRVGLFCSQTDGALCKLTPSLCKTVVRCLNCTVLEGNQRCTLRTVRFYSRIGGALSELGCSIVEPAVRLYNCSRPSSASLYHSSVCVCVCCVCVCVVCVCVLCVCVCVCVCECVCVCVCVCGVCVCPFSLPFEPVLEICGAWKV